MRAIVSACAIVLASTGLVGCDEKTDPQEIVKTTKSKLGRDSQIQAPANWFIVPASQEMPLLLSGTEGPQRIVLPGKQTGYTVAIVEFDCAKGIKVQQIRFTKRDNAKLAIDKNGEAKGTLGIEGNLPGLCNNPEGYRRVGGTLEEAIREVRKQAPTGEAPADVKQEAILAKDDPGLKEVKKTITLPNGEKITTVELRPANEPE